MREQTLQIGDRTVQCAVGPDNGPPLVLFHGVTRCWQDFEAVLPGLVEKFQVFAPDHRGHGGSSWGGSEYRIADFSRDAVAFLDAFVPRSAILLGHSLGAMVAAMVAVQRPSRVRGLILEDPPGTLLAERFPESRFRLQFTHTLRLLRAPHDVDSLTNELAVMQVQRPSDGAVVHFSELRDARAIRFGAECLMKVDPQVLSTLTEGRWLEELDWFEALLGVECPTLLLRADPATGGMLDADEATRIASLIPDCTRVDLPGIGHAIHSTQPEKMLSLVQDFVVRTGLLSSTKTA